MANDKKGKTLKQLPTLIVELKDKGGIFNDAFQGVCFTAGSLVQEVKRTPLITRAIREGALHEVNGKRLEEWKKERAEYLVKHTKAKDESNQVLAAAATTSGQKLKVEQEKNKTVSAENKGLKKDAAAKDKEIEALKAEIAKGKEAK